MPIPEAAEFIRQIDDPLARDIKTEILKRMNALIEIGLSYLSLSRGTDTLSGGEAQRIKIARYINSPLTDMMYVLDEPSVGLHSRDIQNLKNSLIKAERARKYRDDCGTPPGSHRSGGSHCGYGTGSGHKRWTDHVSGKLREPFESGHCDRADAADENADEDGVPQAERMVSG